MLKLQPLQRNRRMPLNKYKIIILVVLAHVLFITAAKSSQASPIPSYDISADKISLNPFKVYYITDITRNRTIDDIASGTLPGVVTPSRLHTKSLNENNWICFSVVNPSSKYITRIIHLDEPLYDEVTMYYRSENNWHEEQSGLSIPLDKRLIYNRTPVFSIPLDPGQSRTIYIKIHSNYGLFTVGCSINDPATFLIKEQKITAWYFFYFGVISALLVYNFFLFIALRDKLYVYYVLHGLFFGFMIVLYGGYDLYFGSNEILHYRINGLVALVLVFISLFSRELLQTSKNIPTIDFILKLIVWVGVILCILITIDITYYEYLTLIGLPSYLFFIFVGIYAWIKRIELSNYYLLSTILYFIGIVLLALLLMNLVPYNVVTRYSFLVGSMAELTIFSLALAHRVKLLQKQNIAYQLELIQTEREAKERLAKEVAERTAELTQANSELEQMAKQDGLTGLANRRFLDEQLDNEWHQLKRKKSPLSVIMCDIDYFKFFNDHYGHQKGDACLISVAKAIRSSLKRPGDMAGRYGGEEFLILLPDTDTDGAIHVATRIKKNIAALGLGHAQSKISDYVTLSFGVASLVPSEEIAPESIVSFADKALYQAKRNGRNQVSIASQTVQERR